MGSDESIMHNIYFESFFPCQSDDDKREKAVDEAADLYEEETAQEKRLRLTKQYLSQLDEEGEAKGVSYQP